MRRLPIYLEAGSKRVFAGAVDWPGWARSGKSDEAAVATLLAYGERYRSVVAGVDPSFVPPADAGGVELVERLAGGSGTDFGVPSLPTSADERPIDEAELARLSAILAAA